MAKFLGGILLMLGFHAWLGGIIGFVFGGLAYMDRFRGKHTAPDMELMFWLGITAFLISFPLAWIGDKLMWWRS